MGRPDKLAAIVEPPRPPRPYLELKMGLTGIQIRRDLSGDFHITVWDEAHKGSVVYLSLSLDQLQDLVAKCEQI